MASCPLHGESSLLRMFNGCACEPTSHAAAGTRYSPDYQDERPPATILVRARLGRPKPMAPCPWSEKAPQARLRLIHRLIETDGVVRSVERDLGIDLSKAPAELRSWVATKVKATDRERSQDHAHLIAAGVQKLWAAVPGKMSSCIYAAKPGSRATATSVAHAGRCIWEPCAP